MCADQSGTVGALGDEGLLDRGGEVGPAGAEGGPVHPQPEVGASARTASSTCSSGGFDTTSTHSVGRVGGERAQRLAGGAAADRGREVTTAHAEAVADARRPAASRRHIACCAPVPEAATMPTGPGRTTLAKPRATPPTRAVPQSGPMTSTSAAAAASLRATSSATETLSENSITDAPAAMAS